MSATPSQEELLELSELLKDKKFVDPVNLLVDGFSKGSIESIVSSGILFDQGTDTLDPKYGPRRYENYRISTQIPGVNGLCSISIDPLHGEKGFVSSVKLESDEIPYSHAGIKEGLFNWLTSPNRSNVTATIFEIYNTRGAISEVLETHDVSKMKSLSLSAKKAGYEITTDVKSDGFVFTVSERFYLATDFVNRLDPSKPFINMLEIKYIVKQVRSETPQEEGCPIETIKWTVVGQAKFFTESKVNIDLNPEEIVPIMRSAMVNGTFNDYVKDISTVQSNEKMAMFLVGRESNPKLLITVGLDQKLTLNESFSITKDEAVSIFNDLAYPDIKEKFINCMESMENPQLVIQNNYIEILDNLSCLKICLEDTAENKAGFYIVLKDQN